MRKPAALIVATLLLVGVAACGSSSDAKKDDKTTTTTTTTTTVAKGGSDKPTSTGDSGETTTPSGDDTTPTVSIPDQTTIPDAKNAGDADKDAYAAAISKGFADSSAESLKVDPKAAACLGPKWVDAIGLDTLRAKAPKPSDLADPSFGYDELGLKQPAARKMIGAFGQCNVDIYDLIIKSLATTDTQVACVKKEFPQSDAIDFLTLTLTGGTDAKAFEKVSSLDRTCKLSPSSSGSDAPSTNTVAPGGN